MIVNGGSASLKQGISYLYGARRYLNLALAALLLFAIFTTFHSGGDADDSSGPFGALDYSNDNATELVASDAAPPEWTLDETRPRTSSTDTASKGPNGPLTETIVIGRRRKDESKTEWIDELPAHIRPAIYLVDDPGTDTLHLEKNHGREAMVYTKYIVDHWDNLTDITFFWHPDNFVWHNNILLNWTSTEAIKRMNRSYIMQQGYVPSRCDHWPGCPSWITFYPTKFEHNQAPHHFADMLHPNLMHRLFPNRTDHPRYFAETCCSQFAATREAIHNVGIGVFKNLQAWIKEYWADEHSGRVMEMLWQYVFLDLGRNCPPVAECYCKTYGLCIDDKEVLRDIDRMEDFRHRFHQQKNVEDFVKKDMTNRNKVFERLGVEFRILIKKDPDVMRLAKEINPTRATFYKYRDKLIRRFNLAKAPTAW